MPRLQRLSGELPGDQQQPVVTAAAASAGVACVLRRLVFDLDRFGRKDSELVAYELGDIHIEAEIKADVAFTAQVFLSCM
jgi:hypothetical protein